MDNWISILRGIADRQALYPDLRWLIFLSGCLLFPFTSHAFGKNPKLTKVEVKHTVPRAEHVACWSLWDSCYGHAGRNAPHSLCPFKPAKSLQFSFWSQGPGWPGSQYLPVSNSGALGTYACVTIPSHPSFTVFPFPFLFPSLSFPLPPFFLSWQDPHVTHAGLKLAR